MEHCKNVSEHRARSGWHPGIAAFAGKALIGAMALCCALPVAAQHRHVHGEGRLNVSIEPGLLTLALELPLEAVLGFERAPSNAQEKSVLIAAQKILSDAHLLWQPTVAAACSVQSVEVTLPKFAAGEHADIDARYRFTCAQADALKGIETTLFKYFKRLYRIETQRVGPKGQGAQRLTPKNPQLGW